MATFTPEHEAKFRTMMRYAAHRFPEVESVIRQSKQDPEKGAWFAAELDKRTEDHFTGASAGRWAWFADQRFRDIDKARDSIALPLDSGWL